MGLLRFAAIAALSSSLIITAAGPVAAHGTRTGLEPPAVSIAPDVDVPVGGVTTLTVTDVPSDTVRVVLSHAGKELSSATSAPWALTWDTRGPEQNGVVGITVERRDGTSTGHVRFYDLDRTGPAIYAGPNWIREVLGRGDGIVAVNYYDPADVARIEWRVNGELRSTDQVATIDFGQVNRVVEVEARVYDAFGNVSTAGRQVRIDATGPTITSVTPAQGAVVRGSTLWSEVKAVDDSGIEQVVVIDPGNLPHEFYSAPYRLPLRIIDGPTPVTWKVYDRVWNETVVQRVVTVDNTLPALRVTSAPKNGAKVKGTVKVSAAAWDRYGIGRVELLINGKVVARDHTAAYTFSINTRSINIKKYGKKFKVQLRAYDRAGNAATTPVRTWKR